MRGWWSGVFAFLAALLAPAADAQARVLSSTIGLVPPAGTRVIDACGPILMAIMPDTAGRDNTPEGVCIYFLDTGTTPIDNEDTDSEISRDYPSSEAFDVWIKAMNASGWAFAHFAVVTLFFERPKPGTECSDIASLTILPQTALQKLVGRDAADGSYEGRRWRGFFIPADDGEACGDGRRVR